MSLTLTFQHTVILLYSFYNCEFLTWRHSGQGTQKPLLRKAQHRPPHTEASQAFHTTAFSAASSFKLTFEIDYFELFPHPFFWGNTGEHKELLVASCFKRFSYRRPICKHHFNDLFEGMHENKGLLEIAISEKENVTLLVEEENE